MTGSKTMTQASENGSSEAVEWELRPGGMLVQKREDETSSTVPLVKIKVFHDSYQHEVTVPAQSTFEAEHERKLMDFVNLRLRDMTVGEFEQKFTRLAQFVPYLIDTPTKHKNWFIKALRDELQDLVRVTNASTFEEVVTVALHLEAATKNRATRTSQPKIEKITSCPNKGRKKVFLAVIQEKSKNDVRTCFNCQKRGHVAKGCKKVRHVARFCKNLEQTQLLTTLPLYLVVNKGRDLVNFQGRVYALTKVDATVSDVITWELKKVLAQETDLTPDEQRLLFRGKEKEDDERLHMAGVKDMSRVVLLQDPASRERKLEQVKRVQETSKASGAVASVRDEVDKLVEKVYALESYIHRDSKVNEQEFVVLTELLMRLLLKLDGIEADGEAKVQRRAEVRRIQHHVAMLDTLKFRNSTQFRMGPIATIEWHTVGSDDGSLNAQTGNPTSEVTDNWEKFE